MVFKDDVKDNTVDVMDMRLNTIDNYKLLKSIICELLTGNKIWWKYKPEHLNDAELINICRNPPYSRNPSSSRTCYVEELIKRKLFIPNIGIAKLSQMSNIAEFDYLIHVENLDIYEL